MSDHSSHLSQNNLDDLSGLSVGEILRRTRMHYGHQLNDVESVLRIRAELLEAIEADDMSKLPGRVYAIGFIRSYAEYLSLDGDQIVTLFKQQLGQNALKPEYNFPVAVDESKRPDFKVFLISIIGLIVVVLSYQLFKPSDNVVTVDQEEPAIVSNELTAETVVEETQSVEQGESVSSNVWPPRVEDVMPEQAEKLQVGEGAEVVSNEVEETLSTAQQQEPKTAEEEAIEQTSQSTEASVSQDIRIVANAPTWMRVRDSEGETVFTGILKQGRDIKVPENAIGWRMDTGNAGGLDIYIGEEKLPPLGGNGIVVRRVPLFADALRERTN